MSTEGRPRLTFNKPRAGHQYEHGEVGDLLLGGIPFAVTGRERANGSWKVHSVDVKTCDEVARRFNAHDRLQAEHEKVKVLVREFTESANRWRAQCRSATATGRSYYEGRAEELFACAVRLREIQEAHDGVEIHRG